MASGQDLINMEIVDSDIPQGTDWSSADYMFEDTHSWSDSLLRCYVRPPIDQFKKYKFVYEPDTLKQIEVKTKAAEHALKYVQEKYDSRHATKNANTRHRELFFARANYFFCCLRTFHPLTLHCKCESFAKFYKTAGIYSCPFSKGAVKWRNHYRLDFFSDDFTKVCCNLNKPQQLGVLNQHLMRVRDEYLFHEGVMKYYQFCHKHLPSVAKFYAEKINYVTTIHTKKDNFDVDPTQWETVLYSGNGDDDDDGSSPLPTEILVNNQEPEIIPRK